jgi:hypothetical protein
MRDGGLAELPTTKADTIDADLSAIIKSQPPPASPAAVFGAGCGWK